MRVLVIGAQGFVGPHLVAALREEFSENRHLPFSIVRTGSILLEPIFSIAPFPGLTSRWRIFRRRRFGAFDIDAFALHHDRASPHLRVYSCDILTENSNECELHAGQEEQGDDHRMGTRRRWLNAEDADDEGERSI